MPFPIARKRGELEDKRSGLQWGHGRWCLSLCRSWIFPSNYLDFPFAAFSSVVSLPTGFDTVCLLLKVRPPVTNPGPSWVQPHLPRFSLALVRISGEVTDIAGRVSWKRPRVRKSRKVKGNEDFPWGFRSSFQSIPIAIGVNWPWNCSNFQKYRWQKRKPQSQR